jgi:hypothetical protein
MNRKLTSTAALVAGGLACWLGGPVSAQQEKTGKANWLTDGGDSQRTSWQRNEKLIGKATAKDITLLWTLQTDNQPRQLHNLFAPLIVSDVATAAGPREIAILAGVSDNIYGIDVEKGTQIWKRHFDSTFTEPTDGRGYGPLCPGGLTATPVVAPLASTRSMQSRGMDACGSSMPRRVRISRPRNPSFHQTANRTP